MVVALLAEVNGFPKRRRKRPDKRSLGADEADNVVLDPNAIGGDDGGDDSGSGTGARFNRIKIDGGAF